MPNCKNCGARITKFDKDMCPICGTLKPLEGVSSETVEITSEIDLKNPEFKEFKPVRRSLICLFSSLLGPFGIQFFYMKYLRAGFIWLISNLLFIGGLGCILFFAAKMPALWSFLIPLFISYFINILFGVIALFLPNLKDGKGEFVR